MAFDSQKLKEFFTFKRRGEQGKDDNGLLTTSTGKYEVNLMPEVKLNMLHTQKVRNLVMFIAIVVCAASIGVVGILGIVKASQDVTMSDQDTKLDERSKSLNGLSNLNEILTIQEQLNKISSIEENKKVLSRVFNMLSVLLPSGLDKVSISDLTVDLDNSTLSFQAQADAGKEPFIDYKVLESFKKSVEKVKYDYGRYVTAEGVEIPSRCIKETDENGKQYMDEKTGDIYVMWRRDVKACRVDESDEEGQENDGSANNSSDSSNSSGSSNNAGGLLNNSNSNLGLNSNLSLNNTTQNQTQNQNNTQTNEDNLEKKYEDVKIWRTPQFDEWKKEDHMTLDGQISGVEHFESKCYTYSGTEGSNGKVEWSAQNECMFAEDGLVISDSGNARNASGNLVLSFSASIKVASDAFAYNNKHVMTIGPFGQNVTDSYLSTNEVFEAPAKECEENDKDCANNTENITGE